MTLHTSHLDHKSNGKKTWLVTYTKSYSVGTITQRRWRRQNLGRTGPDYGPDHGPDHGSDNRSDHGSDHGSDHRKKKKEKNPKKIKS